MRFAMAPLRARVRTSDVIREGISGAAMRTPVNTDAEKRVVDQCFLNQEGGGTSASAPHADVDPCRRVDWMNDIAKIKRPTIYACPCLEQPVQAPRQPPVKEQRPFVARAEQKQPSRAATAILTAIQERKGRIKHFGTYVRQACSPLDLCRQFARRGECVDMSSPPAPTTDIVCP